ncbi:MAG TPA: ABC transporter substrate-binding protein [Pseudonocardiaceae bacterium]|jgi:peptide/nickel transport system substrate-binding protein|nr:ABC transporter substrate-binding protein [Pseudonocardiaceae bacterium]
MRVNRRAALAIAGVLAMATLAACGGGGSSASANTGVLNVGMPNGPLTDNNNPFLPSSASASLGYRYVIYEPLVMLNPVRPTDPGKPWLATKWSWNTNYTTLTATIRNNVTWSDGQKMTAQDVAFTFDLMKTHAALNTNALPISSTSVNGDEAVINFSSPQFVNQYKILGDTVIVPQHIWSKMSDPTTDPVTKPVGTGPYTLKSFTAQTVVLDERSGYWQTAPQVKELRYTSYNDNNAQTTALANGAAEWSFVFIPNAKAVYEAKDPAHNKLWFPAILGIHGLWFNTTKAPLNDPTLRKAIAMVINRHDIFQEGEDGYFYPEVTNITGIPTPTGNAFLAPQYKSSNVTVDVAGAKKMLTDAGYKYNGNTLMTPSGKPVTFTLSDPAGWSDYQTDLAIIKDNLSQIGIDANVDKANEDVWTKNVDTGQFDAVMHWTNNGATPYDIFETIMDGALYKPVGTGGVNGDYGRFNDPQATAALKQYADATTDAARTAAMNTIQQIMVDKMPMVPTSAANDGGEYSTKHWVGWPSADNPYAPAQPTLPNAIDILLHLKPATS